VVVDDGWLITIVQLVLVVVNLWAVAAGHWPVLFYD